MKLSNASTRLLGQKMFQILEKCQNLESQGKKIYHFEIGDPDFDTPSNIKNAAIESLLRGDTHYSKSSGIDVLKEKARHVTLKSRGFLPDFDQILVTPGANFQIYLASACILNPGDEVIIPNPSFVSYNSIAQLIGAKIISVPLSYDNNYKIDPDYLRSKITKNTKLIIINSPNNPTGSVMSQNDFKEIYEIAEENDIYLISDEIYSRMIYKDHKVDFYSPSTIDQCKNRVILINGLSKSYAMTGWRIGLVTGPKDLIYKMALLQETLVSCVPVFTQYAALEAISASQVEINHMVDQFKKRRDMLYNGLRTLNGFELIKPDGAFYMFPRISKINTNSQMLADEILDKLGIAVAPGSIFGEYGEGHIRFCFANSMQNIEIALEKLKKYFGEK